VTTGLFLGTLPEQKIFNALITLGYEGKFEFQSGQFGGRTQRGGLVFDFYIPELRISINCQGIYWHYTREGGGARDKIQRLQAESNGIRLIYIDEDDANRNAVWYVKEALRGIDHSRMTT